MILRRPITFMNIARQILPADQLDGRSLDANRHASINRRLARPMWRKAMCQGKTHVRVCISTKVLVDQLIKDTELAESKGHIKSWWEGDTLTTAEMIDQLVRREIAHRRRSKRQRRSRARHALAISERGALTPPSKEDLMDGLYDLAAPSDDWGAANRGE